MKNIGYFTKILLIMVVLIIAKSSSNVNVAKVENENVNKTINLSTMALKVDEIEGAEIRVCHCRVASGPGEAHAVAGDVFRVPFL